MRLVHLGLGNFFRAHQAWYTDRAGDGWGIAAFSGRSAELADALSAQDGLYTLVTRAGDGDRFDVISSLARAYPAARHDAWLAALASPDVRGVTITVTEAGYLRGADGGLDRDRAEVRADADALRADPTRSRAHRAGPPAGGARRAPARGRGAARPDPVRQPARERRRGRARRRRPRGPGRAGPARLARDVGHHGDDDGRPDHAAHDPGGRRRRWRRARPLPGGHRAVQRVGAQRRASRAGARAGRTPARRSRTTSRRSRSASCGCSTAVTRCWPTPGRPAATRRSPTAWPTTTCRAWLEAWWAEASRHLTLPAEDLARYREALLERFANPRMRHLLAQIAADGSQKLPIRILPVLRAERSAGRMPEGAAARARGVDLPSARRRRTGRRPARRRAGRARRRPAAGGGAARSSRTSIPPWPRTTSWSRACSSARARDALPEVIVGLDVGTTGVKAVAFGVGSSWRRVAIREYPLLHPGPGQQVQDPEAIVAATAAALAECVAAADGRADAGDRAQHRDARADRAGRRPAAADAARDVGRLALARAGRGAARLGRRARAAPAQRRARASDDAADQAAVVRPPRAGRRSPRRATGSG